MFIRLTSSDMATIYRGLAVLVLIVVLGVTTTEKQLNSLTQRQDYVQVFNMRLEKTGVYSAYLLGYGYSVSAVYPIAKITQTDNSILIDAAGQKITVPTCVYMDSSELTTWLEVWYRQFVDEAYKTKHSLEAYGKIIRKKIDALMQQK